MSVVKEGSLAASTDHLQDPTPVLFAPVESSSRKRNRFVAAAAGVMATGPMIWGVTLYEAPTDRDTKPVLQPDPDKTPYAAETPGIQVPVPGVTDVSPFLESGVATPPATTPTITPGAPTTIPPVSPTVLPQRN